jgi:hypothetical protein|tara:strand:- start:199 stop:537 length:339 start_codon:yes stop_codon:yes gene_type:complete
MARPSHIEDYLVTIRTGAWFGWTDSKNKIYANLKMLEGDTPPTEKECTDGLKALQDKWDEDNKTYKKNRGKEYPKINEQLDKLYHDMTAGKLDATGEWHKAIKAIKDKYPKE